MSAHTPGPWEQSTFKAANGDVCHGVKSVSASIAVAWTNGRTEDEAIENAHLIAAAPEMLDALNSAREIVLRAGAIKLEDGSYFDKDCAATFALVKINAAIAKATGSAA